MNVSIQELGDHLASYLDRAANGERFIITINEVPTAILAGVQPTGGLARGIADGWVTPPRAVGHPSVHPPLPVRRSSATVLRGDRDSR